MSNRHRKLRIEQMERREMMAGDIAAFVQNGNLVLNEATGQAGLDNSVSIQRLSDTRVRVQGMPTLTDGTISKVNGQAFQDFTVTGNLSVNFGGGSDAVSFAPAFGQISFNEIHIDVAAPPVSRATRTSLLAPILTSVTPPDNDVVFLERFHTHGAVSVNTGVGNDSVSIVNAMIGDFGATPANLTINSGAGADFVRVKSTVDLNQEQTVITGTLDIQTFASLTEKDADEVRLEKIQVDTDVHVRTGDGNDIINMDGLFVLHKLDFDSGAGNDSASVKTSTVIDSLMAHLGEGDDSLTTAGLVTKDLQLFGDGGFDRLFKQTDGPIGKRTQSGWEAINGLPPYFDNGGLLSA